MVHIDVKSNRIAATLRSFHCRRPPPQTHRPTYSCHRIYLFRNRLLPTHLFDFDCHVFTEDAQQGIYVPQYSVQVAIEVTFFNCLSVEQLKS